MSASEISLPVSHLQPEHVHGLRLTGGWRTAGVVAWAVVWLISLGAFFLATYIWFNWDTTPIEVSVLRDPDIPPESRALMVEYQAAIQQMGMSLLLYGSLFAGLRLIACVPYFVLSVLIMRRRNDRLMAVLFATLLAVAGAAGRWSLPNWIPLPDAYSWSKVPVMLLDFILGCGLILFYVLPDGRFVPRWTRWLSLAVLLLIFVRTFLPNSPLNPYRLPGLAGSLPTPLFVLTGLLAMVYRYRRRADAVQKQQIKWIVAGVSLLGLFFFAHFIIYNTPLLEDWNWTARNILILELVLEPGWYVAQALFAVCIGISLFRYRLWEIDLVINRVLVYGSLTLLTMAAYLVAVAALGSLFRGVASPLVLFLATGFIAILFEPLRRRLQRLVNRMMYGERDEPYGVLTRLADTLGHSATPSEMLPAIARTVSQALKIPYVDILIHENGEDRLVASVGQPQEEYQSFPLVYQAEVIGTLRVGRRSRGEELSPADRRLIENIARQAGAAAHALRLNAELVRSRAGIVTAREEERRRLRRDLHDGLGPILASQTLKMAAVRQLVRQNPERAEEMVDNIIQQNESTVSELRRLVYGLRPPALDDLGLVEAVRDLIRRSESGDQSITVEGPDEGLPKLPAAVESNAYRIALEGLTNATRHAQARHCIIRFACQEQLHNGESRPVLVVQITDDGVGMPDQYRAGVGIRSMRERAEELGGILSITSAIPHGTQVNAWLPLVEWK
jgi:signal transduction histidine kinase